MNVVLIVQSLAELKNVFFSGLILTDSDFFIKKNYSLEPISPPMAQ